MRKYCSGSASLAVTKSAALAAALSIAASASVGTCQRNGKSQQSARLASMRGRIAAIGARFGTRRRGSPALPTDAGRISAQLYGAIHAAVSEDARQPANPRERALTHACNRSDGYVQHVATQRATLQRSTPR
jgi:hypothetical protein